LVVQQALNTLSISSLMPAVNFSSRSNRRFDLDPVSLNCNQG
jgi:hypothetical protein